MLRYPLPETGMKNAPVHGLAAGFCPYTRMMDKRSGCQAWSFQSHEILYRCRSLSLYLGLSGREKLGPLRFASDFRTQLQAGRAEASGVKLIDPRGRGTTQWHQRPILLIQTWASGQSQAASSFQKLAKASIGGAARAAHPHLALGLMSPCGHPAGVSLPPRGE